MTVFASMPSFGATCCHSSSVTNGTSGCSRRSRLSSTYKRVWRVLSAAALSSPCSAGLASSTNQDREGGGEGKGVSVRVGLGGRRFIKKKKHRDNQKLTQKKLKATKNNQITK